MWQSPTGYGYGTQRLVLKAQMLGSSILQMEENPGQVRRQSNLACRPGALSRHAVRYENCRMKPSTEDVHRNAVRRYSLLRWDPRFHEVAVDVGGFTQRDPVNSRALVLSRPYDVEAWPRLPKQLG